MACILVFPEEFRSDEVTVEVVTREDPVDDVVATEEVAGEEPCDKVVAILLTAAWVEGSTVEDPFNDVRATDAAAEGFARENPSDDVTATEEVPGEHFSDDVTATSLAESDEVDWLDDVSDDVPEELPLSWGCFTSFSPSFSSNDGDDLFPTFSATLISLTA